MKITKIERFIIYPVLVGLVVLFAFFDLDITHALYNPDNIFGKIGECIAEAPFNILAAYACLMLFKTRDKEIKGRNIGFGILYMVLAIFFAGYNGGRIISYTPNYGMSTWLRWLLAVVAALFSFGLAYLLAWKTKIEDRKKIVAVCLFIVLLWVATLLTMNFFKFIWHRPRWRYIVTLDGDPDQYFQPIYVIGCNGTLSSNYASFPSGHTLNAIGVISICLLCYCIPSFKNVGLPLRLFAYLWAILCALSRVIRGAHFSTDVTSGFLLGFLMFDLFSAFLFPFFARKVEEFNFKKK